MAHGLARLVGRRPKAMIREPRCETAIVGVAQKPDLQPEVQVRRPDVGLAGRLLLVDEERGTRPPTMTTSGSISLMAVARS
jgi:hypothetical protein